MDRLAGVNIGQLVRLWVVARVGIGLMAWIGLGEGCYMIMHKKVMNVLMIMRSSMRLWRSCPACLESTILP